jgi:hypothetical protein
MILASTCLYRCEECMCKPMGGSTVVCLIHIRIQYGVRTRKSSGLIQKALSVHKSFHQLILRT